MVFELITVFYFACCLNISNSLQSTHQQSKIESHLGLLDNEKLFDNIREDSKIVNNHQESVQKSDNNDIAEIRAVLSNLLLKVNDLERRAASFTLFTHGKPKLAKVS